MANYFVKLRFLVDHGYDLLFQFKEPGAEVPPSLKEFPLVIRKNQRYIKVDFDTYTQPEIENPHNFLIDGVVFRRFTVPKEFLLVK